MGVIGNETSDPGYIFKFDLSNRQYYVLDRFAGGRNDSCNPNGGVVLTDDGKLFGTTQGNKVGGGNELGIIYQMNIDGSGFKLLYEFTGKLAGDTPMRTPLLINGSLYGMTAYGGQYNYGTIYRFKP